MTAAAARDASEPGATLERVVGLRQLGLRITVLIVAATLLAYAGVYWRTQQLLIDTVKEEAKSYLDLVMMTRAWNSHYGGVYVLKRPGVVSSPELLRLGIDPDIKTADGRVLTLRNPALMTLEVSELTHSGRGVAFHLASLRPIDGENAANPVQRQCLEAFERGAPDSSLIAGRGADRTFHYMKPLRADPSCLECHGRLGYKAGDILGGISVDVPMRSITAEMNTNALVLAAIGIAALATILMTVRAIITGLARRLESAQHRLHEMAVTDELTGISNRRYIVGHLRDEFGRARRTGRPLSVAVFDVDDFKQVNDELGHVFGDLVLKRIVERSAGVIRPYDLLGRWGGDEFLLVAPEAGRAQALDLGERLRRAVSAEPISDGQVERTVAVSVGVAEAEPDDESVDQLLARADLEMYKAKAPAHQAAAHTSRRAQRVPHGV